MSNTAADLAFIKHKSRHAVTYHLVNVQRLHQHPSAMSMGRPLKGRTVIVAGASYALTRNGQHLARAQRRGAVVLGTNSSAPVLAHYGVRPDAIVVRESIDNSAEVRASDAPLVVLDTCAHPEMWAAAGERAAWFVAGYPRHLATCQRLGVRPLYGGTAAHTSAVALAIEWGAARVVLVGAGLGMETIGGELRPYHPAAPRGTLRGHVIDGEDMVQMWGNEANDALTIASGQPPQPSRASIRWLPAADNGGVLPALDTLADEHEWLQTQAGRHGGRVELVNATEGGAGIVGWRQRRLVDVVGTIERAKPPRFPAPYVTERACFEALRDLRAECDTLETMTGAMLRKGGPDMDAVPSIDGVHYGAPLVECLAAWRIADAPRTDPLARSRYVYEALRTSAHEARAILAGGGR